MSQHCKNLCHHFLNYQAGNSGKHLYKKNIVFCRLCDGGYTLIGTVYCPCCKAKVRHNGWYGPNRKAKKDTTKRY